MKKKSCLNQESPLSRGITHLVLVFASFLAFGPFVWMFLTSIKTYEETIRIPMKFLPEIPQWVNYAIVFSAAVPEHYSRNSSHDHRADSGCHHLPLCI